MLHTYRRSPFSLAMRIMLVLSIAFTVGMLAFILIYILANGIPYITPSLFSMEYTSDNVSMLPSIITTLMLVAASLVISLPFGIFTAVYLVEYAAKGSRIVEIIRLTTETLSGIPSIVYGLFGNIFFVTVLGWKYSFLAGVMTMSVMILPLIMRTTEEALIAVPQDWRQASFGLGAGNLRTVFKIVLPSAVPGILSGVILATGRVVGETAALIYTLGTMAKIPDSVFSSGRTLALHMWVLSGEGLHINQAYATAVVLVVIVVAINALSSLVAKKLQRR
ncbi:MAG: phosphate ABC transporter permease PstA [Oscillospiraceae bacterium]|nr:phosphate ABC transporter permease PstA [Oscillospiraceae bacterium]